MSYSAFKIASSIHYLHKIKQVGDIALSKGDIEMAIECYESAEDLNSLLLIYTSLSLPDSLAELAVKAEKVLLSVSIVDQNEHSLHLLLSDKPAPQVRGHSHKIEQIFLGDAVQPHVLPVASARMREAVA